MPRPPTLSANALKLQLQAQGFGTAQALAEQMGVDRSTVSRALSSLGDEVLRMGAARRTRYALRRTLRTLGRRWPLYRMDQAGRAHEFGTLHTVHGGCVIESAAWPAWLEREYPQGVFPGLPFFLSDARPQGFIGRSIARSLGGTLRFPTDPRDWQDDDTLAYLVAHGAELPGDWIAGDAMLEAAHTVVISVIADPARAEAYAQRATAAMQGEVVGSSAAGEQPKFTAWVGDRADPRAVLVKFSPPLDSPSGRRWGDLLVAESLAADVLLSHGHAAVRTDLLDGGNRRFLEIVRYDRVGARGRRGLLTLHAAEAGLVSEAAENWPAVAGALLGSGFLAPDDAAALRRRWCFGRLIANTDMHLGNAALWFDPPAPLRLAPSYDMLPMLYAPGPQGEIVPREFRLAPPAPALREDWRQVLPWAVEFWRRLASDARVSDDFRRIAVNGIQVAKHAEA
ncbi:MAG: type II toxin-antitoxin system HipA family toxin YjjJ [Opitutae bacterium]|nr:type II toxin-antitoxin system HipA family toxin YjjJ [Opitutae bacterium]